MSDPTDIKALDEYLKGGSDISQRYRELGSADVPPELDRRVLDQARVAVAAGGAGRSRSWVRWSAPVALAASVVLVVAVVIQSPVQDETIAIQPASEVSDRDSYAEESTLQQEAVQAQLPPEPQVRAIVPEQPAPAPAPAPPSIAKMERKRADQAPASEPVRVTAQREAREASRASTPVTVVTDTAVEAAVARNEADRAAGIAAASAAKADDASSELQEIAVTGSRQRRSQGRTAGPRNTISGSVFESRPAVDAEAEQRDPAAWLEEIRDLRRAGKTAEADRAWEQFVAEYPDYAVADDDFARKRP